MKNAAVQKVSGLVVWWDQFKENIQMCFDGNVKDKWTQHFYVTTYVP